MPEAQNDPSIGNGERVWRRVQPTQIDWACTPPRVSSAAFSTTDGLSVSLASETTIEALTQNYPEHSVVEFEVGFARSLGCGIIRDPTEDDPSHCLVFGPKARGRMTQTQNNSLRAAAIQVRLCRPTPETAD